MAWDTGPHSSAPLTILERKELKYAVHDGHDDGQGQQVWVGLQEGDLGKSREVSVACVGRTRETAT